jgi:hypothetical protein
VDDAVRCVLLSLSTCQPVDTHTVVDKRRLTEPCDKFKQRYAGFTRRAKRGARSTFLPELSARLKILSLPGIASRSTFAEAVNRLDRREFLPHLSALRRGNSPSPSAAMAVTPIVRSFNRYTRWAISKWIPETFLSIRILRSRGDIRIAAAGLSHPRRTPTVSLVSAISSRLQESRRT